MDDVQRRAKAGGELGANGEWYEGGKFIATVAHTIKQAPIHLDRKPDTEASLALREKWARERASAEAWLAGRIAMFTDVLAALDLRHDGQVFETFENSLGRQLRAEGRVSPRQAACIVRIMFGRRNKANAERFDAMMDTLTERYCAE